MLIRIEDETGARLDAKVEVKNERVILHSRGGAFEKTNLRNPDYNEALKVILTRLLGSDRMPARVLLDSKPAQAFPEDQRILARADDFRLPLADLQLKIGKQAAAFKRKKGAKGPGNATKRVRIDVPGASQRQLRQILAGKGPNSEHSGGEVPPIIYFNIGWMKEYAGPKREDPTIGGHAYLANHTHGLECFNFLPAKGKMRGYRPPGAGEQTNITRLGAGPTDQAIENVVVVWLAKERASGRTLIVGWYRNATVFRQPVDGDFEFNKERSCHSAETSAQDAVLLPPVARSFEVRSSRAAPGEGFGQKPTWFGSKTVNERVWRYINSWTVAQGNRKPGAGKKPPKNVDPELRRKVERAAVEHATAYYSAKYGNESVKSVEAHAVGWDLEVRSGAEEWLVEVKGLLKAGLVCELTPNEYEKMQLPENMHRYVIYVVNNALAQEPAAPIPSIFTRSASGAWETEDGRHLTIAEKTGAVLSCA